MSPAASPAPATCRRRKGGSFRCLRGSQRAHFVLHDATEYDHAVSLSPPGGPPGRHRVLPAERGHRGQAPWLVGADRGEVGPRDLAERRHRLPMGPADRRPAAHGGNQHHPGGRVTAAGPGRAADVPEPLPPAPASLPPPRPATAPGTAGSAQPDLAPPDLAPPGLPPSGLGPAPTLGRVRPGRPPGAAPAALAVR